MSLAAAPTAIASPRHPRWLFGAFALFNALRVVSYFPTFWAIHASGDSSQHSLWTWCTWLGSNLTMSLWLRERNGGHFCRAAAVSMGNASMCGLTLATIVWFRL